MKHLKHSSTFTLIVPEPLILLTSNDGKTDNVMALTWPMVLDYTPHFAISTGPWNHACTALRHTRECILSIPAINQRDTAIAIGLRAGKNTDKFKKFGLTHALAKHLQAPHLRNCPANIECRVIDTTNHHNLIILEDLAAYLDTTRPEQKTIHATGNGIFIADGESFDRKEMMRPKRPAGL